jgi:NADPH-dependent 2,4-dienoyl-CoA reductase/sulfur reductase-like enzyme
MIRRRLVIVGAGPAGVSAAIAAAEVGLESVILDENPLPGGQIYRQSPASLPAKTPSSHETSQQGKALLDRFASLGDRISLRSETSVWGLFSPRRLAVRDPQGCAWIEAEQLILAPGAYEYVPPFPGWTLPGVMTPGGAQQMAKIMGVLPGKRALVAGTGPFLLVVAEQLHRAGMEVVGVVEAAPTLALVRALPRLLGHLGLLRQGVGYTYRLKRAGIPIHRGRLVIEARGEGELREVVLARCDSREWRPDRSSIQPVAVDTLCVGYGFVPRSQLAQLAGCKMRFADELGGWVPVRDDTLQTSVPGLRVAGDGAGVAGALVAQDEGALAGLAAARQLGIIDDSAFARTSAPIQQRLRKLRRFRAALDEISRIRPGLNTLAGPDTIICRCEELTRAEIDKGIDFGGADLRTLKVMTRLGMGPCQGCMCWPAASRRLAERTRKPMEAIGMLSVRPPITPLSLGVLAEETPSPVAQSEVPS